MNFKNCSIFWKTFRFLHLPITAKKPLLAFGWSFDILLDCRDQSIGDVLLIASTTTSRENVSSSTTMLKTTWTPVWTGTLLPVSANRHDYSYLCLDQTLAITQMSDDNELSYFLEISFQKLCFYFCFSWGIECWNLLETAKIGQHLGHFSPLL